MKLKVCGMKYNTQEVAELRPDYLGFIFWKPSKRFFDDKIPLLSDNIEKVGVFVDAPLEDVLEKIKAHGLSAVQLHGKESPEYCGELNVRSSAVETSDPLAVLGVTIIKVFSIKDDFDFSILEPYEEVCDYYLFDTKGRLPGGNSYTFNWEVLKDYPSTKPYFLSGGIGLDEMESIKEFMERPEAKYCHAVDVNSRFENKPGSKDVEKLKKFKEVLSTT